MPYSKKVIDAFRNPHNYGKIKDADGVGKVGNPTCGDVMWLYVKVKDDVITDIRFETFGCIAALASSSIVTDLAKGKSLSQMLKLTKEDILKQLGELPPIKIHCSVLAIDALHEAIYDYLLKNKKLIPEEIEKRHQTLEKEKTAIREKYKGWIEKEEELHQDDQE
jgi:nitrogen fixation NifU-like protein